MKKTINQFVPSVHYYDAVGSTALLMDQFFRSLGLTSKIYALYRDPALADKVTLYRDECKPAVQDDINILHFALPSPLTEFFLNCGGKRVIIYHNITPPHYFRGFQEELVDFTAQGLDEIKLLKKIDPITIAYSDFSAADLSALGFKQPRVLPFLINWDRYNEPENPVLARILDDGWTNLLFVGRLVPNKKQDDLIRLLVTYRKVFHKKTRLLLVGKGREGEKYLFCINEMLAELGNPPVILGGRVTLSELITYYNHAHAFVCMSEHEGFCVPLVEAMYFKLPIIAYNSSAIPNTLGETGILLNSKNYLEFSAWLDKALFDAEFRNSVITRQNSRLLTYLFPHVLEPWKAFVDEILEQ